MSLPLHAYSWAEEPLCTEAPQIKEDIVADGSDIEDEKEERQQKREAIGRAYLKGHVPFLLSARLQGPFDRASGWINPWEKVQRLQSKRAAEPPISGEATPVKITRIQAHDSSGICALEPRHGEARHASRKRPNRGPIGLDEAGHYDADDEDAISEQFFGSDLRVPDAQRHMESGRSATPAQPTCQQSQQVESEEDILQTSQEDLERLIGQECAEFLGNKSRLSPECGRKRAADLSWLKGAHASKRFRYEMPENNTPTPMGGPRRTLNKRKRRSSVALSAESLSSHHSPSLRSPKANSAPPGAQMQRYYPVVRERGMVSLELKPSAADRSSLIQKTETNLANIATSIGDLYGSSEISGSFQFRKFKRKRKAKISSPEHPPDGTVGHDLTNGLAIENYGTSMLSSQETPKSKSIGLDHDASSDTKALTPQRPTNGHEIHIRSKSQPRTPQNDVRVCVNDENSGTVPLDLACSQAMGDQERLLESNTNLLAKSERQQQSPPRALSDDEAREQLISEALSSRPAQPECSWGSAPNTTSNSPMPNGFVRKSPSSHSHEDTDVEVENLDNDRSTSNHPGESADNATSPTFSGGSQVQDPTEDAESPCPTPSPSKHQRHKSPPIGILSLDYSGPSENHDIWKQSPWTTAAVDSLTHFMSRSGTGANDGHEVDVRSSGHSEQEVECDAHGTERHFGSQEKLLVDGPHTPDNDDIGIFEEFLQSSPIKIKVVDQSLSGIPSTQVLVDATTANPWTSALKKPKSAKCNKRVSFSPTTLSHFNGSTTRSSLRQSRQLGSPPPPSGISAFQRLEVKDDIHVKLLNALQGNSSFKLASATSVASSPAVDAMAEAFIAADRQSSTIGHGNGDKSDRGLTHGRTSMPLQPQSKAANRGRDDPSSSNMSFSVAPNGKVTSLSGGVDVVNKNDSLDLQLGLH